MRTCSSTLNAPVCTTFLLHSQIPRIASATSPTIGHRKRRNPEFSAALWAAYATPRAPEATAAVGPDRYDENSAGRWVGTTPPGASLCTTLGSRNASAEAAVAAESPARAAIVLMALLPSALSTLSPV